MDQKVKFVGCEPYEFKTPDGQLVKLANLYFVYNKKGIDGVGCKSVCVTQRLLGRYNLQLNEEYIAVFYRDANNREKLAAVFEEGK